MCVFARESFQAPLTIIVLLRLLMASTTAASRSCDGKARARTNTSIYNRPPCRSTATGWNYGDVVADLDYAGSRESRPTREILRQAAAPVLVSPIVFLGLMQTSHLTATTATSGQACMVFLCIAFQNRFFWQTLLGRKAARTSST